LEVAIRYIHIEVRPADYAEIIALPILSICGCGDFSRQAATEDKAPGHVTFLLNFLDELRRKVPAGK
jgi:hypothetical protein